MLSLEQNRAIWDGTHDWSGQGEEWSETWGGSAPQWWGAIAPRLNRWLPARAVLEIAPGYGRWTHYLLGNCSTLLGIDLSGECVEACRRRFAGLPQARFEQNDGLSLDAAPDGAFDLVFSFDSLVHADPGVLDSYVRQILAKLTPAGVAFLHHSNLAALPAGTPNPHSRHVEVSAEAVAAMVAAHGGRVLVQERVNWGQAELVDGFSLFARAEHPDAAPPTLLDNPRFMAEAELIRAAQAPWFRMAR
jgi:SAM-dependent methyltransferase